MTPTPLKQKLVRPTFSSTPSASTRSTRATREASIPYTLNELSSQGGGYTEIIGKPADLGPATERIAEELNHQYVIGYTPLTRGDGKYHTVRVRVTNDSYKGPRPTRRSFASGVPKRHGVLPFCAMRKLTILLVGRSAFSTCTRRAVRTARTGRRLRRKR
jgi:hypothetical protein